MTKSEHNKFSYDTHKPTPLRFGKLKLNLQIEAFERGLSMHELYLIIVVWYLERKEVLQGS